MYGGHPLSKRIATYAPTRAAVNVALQAAGELLDAGPEGVTLASLAGAVGKSSAWVEAYIGRQGQLPALAARALVDGMRIRVQALDPTMHPARRVVSLVSILVPLHRHRAAAWALVLCGWEAEQDLALEISRALAPDVPTFAMELGTGMLGAVRACLLPGYLGTRDDLARHLAQMTRSTEHFEHLLHEGGEPGP